MPGKTLIIYLMSTDMMIHKRWFQSEISFINLLWALCFDLEPQESLRPTNLLSTTIAPAWVRPTCSSRSPCITAFPPSPVLWWPHILPLGQPVPPCRNLPNPLCSWPTWASGCHLGVFGAAADSKNCPSYTVLSTLLPVLKDLIFIP